MAFLIASTNLVFEIFVVIFSLLGFAFFMGELVGGIVFIIVTALLFARLLPGDVKAKASQTLLADEQKPPMIEHHHDHAGHKSHAAAHACHHHEVVAPENPTLKDKLKIASRHFVMNVEMVGKDILIGVIISAILMVVVPRSFWSALFLADNANLPPFAILFWNAVVGVLIAVLSFVCSVGNIVLAAIL